jgi:probable addiction module antidote protein
LKSDLQNPEFATGILDDALADADVPGFLTLLQDVVRANIGMTQIAETTGLGRESLYTALSSQGNPSFATISKILDALGYRFTVVEKSANVAP